MSTGSTTPLLSSARIEWIESLRIKYGIPGMAVAVARGPKSQPAGGHPKADGGGAAAASGWTSQIETFGKRNCRGDPFENDTIFGIASNSKVFANLSVSLLIERGTKLPNGQPLTWRTKVKDVLGDDWVLPDEYATNHADLDDLAGMRLGMAAHHFGRMPLNPPLSPAQQLRNMRNFTMATELRREFAYDSHCPLALSQMIPALTGIPYHDFVKQEIFSPIGMSDAYCDSNEVRSTTRAMDGFLRKGGGRAGSTETELLGQAVPVGWWTQDDGLWCLPVGGVAMSMNDGVKLLREFLDPQHLPERVVNSRAEPLTPTPSSFPARIAGPGGPECYGRGQIISSYRGYTVVWHTGNLPGQSTLIACIPSAQVGVVVAINDGSFGAALLPPLRSQLLDDLLGLEATEDYEAKFVKPMLQTLATPSKPHTSSSPSTHHLSWSKVDVGVYYHPGYFTMPLTLFDKSASESEAMIDIARQKGWFYDFDSSCLVARMHKMWLSHLVFRPLPISSVAEVSGRPYEWLAYQVYDIVDENSKPTTGESVATCRGRGGAVVTQRGVGMFGGFKDALVQAEAAIDEELLKDAARVEKEAEVWFARVV